MLALAHVRIDIASDRLITLLAADSAADPEVARLLVRLHEEGAINAPRRVPPRYPRSIPCWYDWPAEQRPEKTTPPDSRQEPGGVVFLRLNQMSPSTNAPAHSESSFAPTICTWPRMISCEDVVRGMKCGTGVGNGESGRRVNK